jgi:hypothetical protein
MTTPSTILFKDANITLSAEKLQDRIGLEIATTYDDVYDSKTIYIDLEELSDIIEKLELFAFNE